MVFRGDVLKIQIDLGRRMTVTCHRKRPCGRCPYKLGLIRTLVNPCVRCKQTGYRTYEAFLRQKQGVY